MKKQYSQTIYRIILISFFFFTFSGLFFNTFSENTETYTPTTDLILIKDGSFPSPLDISDPNLNDDAPSYPSAADDGEDDEDDDDEDGDGVDDDLESLNYRDVEVEFDEKEFHISSELRQGERQDALQIELHIEDHGVELSLEYASESEDGPDIELEFDLTIYRLVEYTDQDGNARFSPDNDTIIQVYLFDSFKDLEYETTPITATSNLHHLTLQTGDENVTFHFFLAEEYVKINGASLAPQQMKIDVEIDNFTYTHPSSALALDVEMISDLDYEIEEDTEDEREGHDSDEEWLVTASTEVFGFFSWKEYALVDGVNRTVGTTFATDEGDDGDSIYFSYPRGTSIYHDPELGVAGVTLKPTINPPPNGPDDSFPVWAIILIVFSSILVVFFGLMSKQEYRTFLLNRISDYSTGPHRLTMEDVLDNKIRNQIISIVMDDPGVHYSELERQVDTSSSNLAWHLDILETYRIVSKKRVGRYLIFYPYVEKNPFADMDVTIVKSKTTLEIFQIIADHPGINQSQLTKRMDLNRKTAKYHIDKLVTANLIEQKKEGTRVIYHPLQ